MLMWLGVEGGRKEVVGFKSGETVAARRVGALVLP